VSAYGKVVSVSWPCCATCRCHSEEFDFILTSKTERSPAELVQYDSHKLGLAYSAVAEVYAAVTKQHRTARQLYSLAGHPHSGSSVASELELTSRALLFVNPENYSAWNTR
jgi:hypothetical protein